MLSLSSPTDVMLYIPFPSLTYRPRRKLAHSEEDSIPVAYRIRFPTDVRAELP
jgi:hypothetical protein